MRVALYARVSSEIQEARGSIGSQIEALRARAASDGHEIAGEFLDDGYSGARLDRPGLDRLRDGAEAGVFEAVLCLTPDRLARSFAYQFIVLEELTRHGVRVLFSDSPPIDDDPQARLLVQMQGVIAEYERAKIAERNRRGRLYRARAGEWMSWKVPYGYRRVRPSPAAPVRLEVVEAEAAVVRRIFDRYVADGLSMRQIKARLYAEGIPSPTGRAVWCDGTLSRLLRRGAYTGTIHYNRHESIPGPTGSRQRLRPAEEWIPIPVPRIVDDAVFEAAQRVSRDNSRFSPRRAEPGTFLLRRLVKCGRCDTALSCRRSPQHNGTIKRYYWCDKRDPLNAGGEDRRCTEPSVRADALDAFVFEQVRSALLRPEVLVAGETALARRTPTPDDELLETQLRRLTRNVERAETERRRLLDLYQTGVVDLVELQRRVADVDARRHQLDLERDSLLAQRRELAHDNRLRQRVADFAARVSAGLDRLDFDRRQQLLRLVVEQVRVRGPRVEIRLRIPLDDAPRPGGDGVEQQPLLPTHGPLSSNVRLRSTRLPARCISGGWTCGVVGAEPGRPTSPGSPRPDRPLVRPERPGRPGHRKEREDRQAQDPGADERPVGVGQEGLAARLDRPVDGVEPGSRLDPVGDERDWHERGRQERQRHRHQGVDPDDRFALPEHERHRARERRDRRPDDAPSPRVSR